MTKKQYKECECGHLKEDHTPNGYYTTCLARNKFGGQADDCMKFKLLKKKTKKISFKVTVGGKNKKGSDTFTIDGVKYRPIVMGGGGSEPKKKHLSSHRLGVPDNTGEYCIDCLDYVKPRKKEPVIRGAFCLYNGKIYQMTERGLYANGEPLSPTPSLPEIKKLDSKTFGFWKDIMIRYEDPEQAKINELVARVNLLSKKK